MALGHLEHRSGLDALGAACALLQRMRGLHPTAGLLEAADLQWWWRKARRTDVLPQLFWCDSQGQPMAAMWATDWGDAVALDPILLPGAAPETLATVLDAGLAQLQAHGLAGAVDVVVDRADAAAVQVLRKRAFAQAEDSAEGGSSLAVVTAWLAADARPALSPLAAGYRLASRVDTAPAPHHFIRRNGAQVEARLRQTALYRPEFDLLVLDDADEVAAYALCWYDPVTATGMVEPMRTEDSHQRRGLARHLLTAGIDRMARTGATRVKLCFSPGNPAARALYLGVGFVPDKQTVVFSRRSVQGC